MTFFRIRESIDSRVIGRKYPQVKDIIIPTTWNDPLFIDSFFSKMAPKNVLLPTPIVWKTTKMTDLLSGGLVGLSRKLLVSKKLAMILQEEQPYGMQFFEVNVLKEKNENFQFLLIHPYDFYFQIIDFEKSEIGYYSLSVFDREPKKETVIRNAKDMLDEISKFEKSITNGNYDFYNLHIEKISFLTDISTDFFSLSNVSGGVGFYVSERLKNKIEAAGCTGIIFTEPNEI